MMLVREDLPQRRRDDLEPPTTTTATGRVEVLIIELILYWFCTMLLRDIIDEHAPLKQRIIKHHQVPYMNCELRKAMAVRNVLWRKFDKTPTKEDWELYR